jgi:hypothetical protein
MIPLLHDCVRLLQNDPHKVERSPFPESMTVATTRNRKKNTICPHVTLLLPPKSKEILNPTYAMVAPEKNVSARDVCFCFETSHPKSNYPHIG